MNTTNISGKKCYLNEANHTNSVIYLGISNDMTGQLKNIFKECHDTFIVAYEIDNWNDELSPWECEAVFGKPFCGKGEETYNWLEQCILYINDKYSTEKNLKHFLCGYSLCGLFSLWAGIKCAYVSGFASCSGSLWFPEWTTYLSKISTLDKAVYLSLGDEEASTNNKYMQKVKENTDFTYEHLRKINSETTYYEMNRGGHFNNVEQRIIKAIRWLNNHGG